MMKRCLVIFDSGASQAMPAALPDETDGLCLSGNALETTDAIACFHKAAGASARLLEAGERVNKQVSLLQTRLDAWSHSLGESPVSRRNTVRTALRIGRTNASAWWFSLLSEKNPFKSDLYIYAARAAAIRELLASSVYDSCHVICRDTSLATAVFRCAAEYGVSCRIHSTPTDSLHKRIANTIRESPLVHMLLGFAVILRFFFQGIQARFVLPPRANRLPTPGDILFVSYSPALAAGTGDEFSNRFYAPLQKALQHDNAPISWLHMHVKLGCKTYRQSLQEAKAMAAAGRRVSMLQEHLGPRDISVVLGRWLLLAFKGLLLARRVVRAAQSQPFDHMSRHLLRRDWLLSTAGKAGAEGILFHAAYDRMFRQLPGKVTILYCLEMHAWEKALVSAARQHRNIRTIGFQHAAFSRNYFHFYQSPETGRMARTPLHLPLPDQIAASGEHSKAELASWCPLGVEEVESIRTLYVNSLLSSAETPCSAGGTLPALLLAGSIDAAENAIMLGMALEAARGNRIHLLLKSHPLCPLERIMKNARVDTSSTFMTILTGTLPEALMQADTVMVPTSTASIEALAFGCRVILPLAPDTLFMNPLIDFPEHFTVARNGKDLLAIMQTEYTAEQRWRNVRNSGDFIRNYWNLDPTLPKWRNLLKK